MNHYDFDEETMRRMALEGMTVLEMARASFPGNEIWGHKHPPCAKYYAVISFLRRHGIRASCRSIPDLKGKKNPAW